MNDNNAPYIEEVPDGGGRKGIQVVSTLGRYNICFIETLAPVMAGTLLTQVCSHPDTLQLFPELVISSMGLMSPAGVLYQPLHLIAPGATVHLCSTKGIPQDDPPPKPVPAVQPMSPPLVHKTPKDFPSPEKKWNMPSDYVGKNEYLHQTINDLIDNNECARIHLVAKSIIVSLRVSTKGCRAKLALEMLCLFEGLNRDEWTFEDVSDKWIKPGILYTVVSLIDKKYPGCGTVRGGLMKYLTKREEEDRMYYAENAP